MWTTEVSCKTRATKNQIWELWADVPNWSILDKDVESFLFSKVIGSKIKSGLFIAVESLIQFAEKN